MIVFWNMSVSMVRLRRRNKNFKQGSDGKPSISLPLFQILLEFYEDNTYNKEALLRIEDILIVVQRRLEKRGIRRMKMLLKLLLIIYPSWRCLTKGS